MEEIDSFSALYSKADDIINKARMSGEPQESSFLIKNVYVVTKQAMYDLPKDHGTTILGKFDKNGKFEMFKTSYVFSLFNDIEAIYELIKGRGISYTELPSDKVHTIFKYTVEINIFASAVDEKAQVGTEISKIYKEEEENVQPSEETISALKKMPYLAGILGIKQINIPVIVDSEIVLQSMQKDCGLEVEPIADALQETLARKIGVISIGNEEIQPIYIPEMLGRDKVYFAYNNIPKNVINMLNSDKLVINNYVFKNDSKIIVLFIKNINEYLKTNTVSQKKGTYITDFLVMHEKEILHTLITSPPISASDFTKYTGYSITDIDKMLSLYSYSIKAGIQAIDYRAMKILFDVFPETVLDDSKNIIYAVFSVFCSYLLINGQPVSDDFDDLLDKMRKFVSENITTVSDNKTIYKNELREKLKSVFEITDYLASAIIEQLDKTGYINIHEDGKTVSFEKQMKALFK
jgi:hypothetical protein